MRICVVAATGAAFLKGLEAEAARRGAQQVVLNARDTVTEFYARHGYAVVDEAETLFGCDSACADGGIAVISDRDNDACGYNYARIRNMFSVGSSVQE